MALPHAVLWDMDGTIVDTQEYWYKAENDFLELNGSTLSEELALEIVGTDLHYGAKILKEHAQSEWPIEDIVNYLLAEVSGEVQAKGVPFQPGAWEMLSQLHAQGVPQALVTMSWQVITEPIVAAFDFNPFSAIITGDQVARGKPDPEPYLAAAQKLGVPIERCVAFEDSPTGAQSAISAGAQVIIIRGDAPVPADWGVRHIDSVAEVTLAELAQLSPGA